MSRALSVIISFHFFHFQQLLVEYLATQTGGATVNNIFEVALIVERVVYGKIYGNIKDAHGQA